MKLLRFPFDQVQAEWIFAPVRCRADIISLLMNATKLMLVNSTPAVEFTAGELILVVSKMSRLFFATERKIVSVAFPFFTRTENDTISFSSNHYEEIDNRLTSIILAIIFSSAALTSQSPLDLASIFDEETRGDPHIWPLFLDLLTYEDGYLRYDYDMDRHNGHLHPLHHIDIFYTGRATFKLGLYRAISADDMRDFLDLLTDCIYLGD